MRQLTDAEIAERIETLASTWPTPDKVWTTEEAVRLIPISAEELLPVGNLWTVHAALRQRLGDRLVLTDPTSRLLPHKHPWKLK